MWTETLFSLIRIELSKNGCEVGTVNMNSVCTAESRERRVEDMRRRRLTGLGAEIDPSVNNIHPLPTFFPLTDTYVSCYKLIFLEGVSLVMACRSVP